MMEDGRSKTAAMRIIFAGSGEFGLPTLTALHANHQIVHVFSQPDRPTGRGRALTPTPITQFAPTHADLHLCRQTVPPPPHAAPPDPPPAETQAAQAPKLNRDSTNIAWTHPAPQIANQIRGMYPWPGCRARLLDPSGNDLARLTL